MTYEAHDFSRRGTTTTSAHAALLLARGDVSFTGIRSLEACVDPETFLHEVIAHADIRILEWEDNEIPRPFAV